MELDAVAMVVKLAARLVVLLLLAVGLRVNQAPATTDDPGLPAPVVVVDETVGVSG